MHISVRLHAIDSFTSGRDPLTGIWNPGPFPYTAVVKCFLSVPISVDTPVKKTQEKWYVPAGFKHKMLFNVCLENSFFFSQLLQFSKSASYLQQSFLLEKIPQKQTHGSGQQ